MIGSLILLPTLLAEISLVLEPADFFDPGHGQIFAAMLWLRDVGKPVDPTLLIDRLMSAGDFEAVGGAAYLSKVINAVPTAAHGSYYADIVREKARLRRLIEASTSAITAAYDGLPAADIAAELETRLIERDRGDKRANPIREVWGRVIDGLQRQVGEAEPPAMLSGIEAADRCGFVFVPGELTILAARPGVGKTSMATQIAMHQATKARPTLFASLEMQDEALASRVLYAAAGLNHQSVRTRGVKQDDVDSVRQARDAQGELPLYVWSPGRVKVGAIRAMATAIKARHGLRLLVVDYTSWVIPDDPRAQRRDQVGEIIKGLRSIGQRLDIPVLLLHQLNREGANERPQLNHLRESGCAEEDADMVAFLHPQTVEQGQPPQVSLIVEKNRQGAKGEVSLLWHPHATRFSSIDEQPVEDRQNYEPNFTEWNQRRAF